MAALVVLMLLAICSVLASGMPRLPAGLLVAWVCWSGVRGARRQWMCKPVALVFPGNGMPAMVDGREVQGMRVEWRGPLAFATWSERPGQVKRLAWWPDTLPAPKRRELRLAAGDTEAAPRRA